MGIRIKGTAKGCNLVDMVDRAVAKAKATPHELTAHERDIALDSGEFEDAIADAKVARVTKLVKQYQDGLITSTEFIESTAWAIIHTGPSSDRGEC
jgi:hypothetical protein|tara:strand:- start:398 stop:685 length:288 start_codon:yes stop_codon:yes gene_type:complete